MLNQKQIKEIREHLEKTQKPLFFFDNDMDGLSSFLLLARAIERGKGVAIKSFPALNKSYIKKVEELGADYVFILDKPLVEKDFIDILKEKNIPIVWIDHHDVDVYNEGVYYYNTTKGENKSNEPVTYWCYKICGKKEDLWIAVAGCISDGFLPEFIEEFKGIYEDLWKENIKSAFEGLYETELGKIARILNFALKDRTTNVIRMLKYLLKIKSPYEILKEDERNFIIKRFKQVNRKFEKLIEKAKKFSRGKILYFQYGGSLSLSSDLSNLLYYYYPEKFIIVAYIKGTKANVSLRGKNAKKITEEAVKFVGGSGGGHEMATGATINVEDLPKFREKIEELVKKYN